MRHLLCFERFEKKCLFYHLNNTGPDFLEWAVGKWVRAYSYSGVDLLGIVLQGLRSK